MTRLAVWSAGGDDGDTCGFTIDGTPVDVGWSGRGINLLVLDPNSGAVLETARCDTYSGADHGAGAGSGSVALLAFLGRQPAGAYLLVAVQGSAELELSDAAKSALGALGAHEIHALAFRDSWALVARTGGDALAEGRSPRGRGRVSLEVTTGPADTGTRPGERAPEHTQPAPPARIRLSGEEVARLRDPAAPWHTRWQGLTADAELPDLQLALSFDGRVLQCPLAVSRSGDGGLELSGAVPVPDGVLAGLCGCAETGILNPQVVVSAPAGAAQTLSLRGIPYLRRLRLDGDVEIFWRDDEIGALRLNRAGTFSLIDLLEELGGDVVEAARLGLDEIEAVSVLCVGPRGVALDGESLSAGIHVGVRLTMFGEQVDCRGSWRLDTGGVLTGCLPPYPVTTGERARTLAAPQGDRGPEIVLDLDGPTGDSRLRGRWRRSPGDPDSDLRPQIFDVALDPSLTTVMLSGQYRIRGRWQDAVDLMWALVSFHAPGVLALSGSQPRAAHLFPPGEREVPSGWRDYQYFMPDPAWRAVQRGWPNTGYTVQFSDDVDDLGDLSVRGLRRQGRPASAPAHPARLVIDGPDLASAAIFAQPGLRGTRTVLALGEQTVNVRMEGAGHSVLVPPGLRVTVRGQYPDKEQVFETTAPVAYLNQYPIMDVTVARLAQRPEPGVVLASAPGGTGLRTALPPGVYALDEQVVGTGELASVEVAEGRKAVLYDQPALRGAYRVLACGTTDLATLDFAGRARSLAVLVDHVTVYAEPGFRGTATRVPLGTTSAETSPTRGTVKLKSLDLHPQLVLSAYSGPAREGHVKEFRHRLASSETSGGERRIRAYWSFELRLKAPDLAPPPVQGLTEGPSGAVIAWRDSHAGPTGRLQVLLPGRYDRAALVEPDQWSALTVPDGWVVTVHSAPGFTGRSLTIRGSEIEQASLNVAGLNDLNDRVASAEVTAPPLPGWAGLDGEVQPLAAGCYRLADLHGAQSLWLPIGWRASVWDGDDTAGRCVRVEQSGPLPDVDRARALLLVEEVPGAVVYPRSGQRGAGRLPGEGTHCVDALGLDGPPRSLRLSPGWSATLEMLHGEASPPASDPPPWAPLPWGSGATVCVEARPGVPSSGLLVTSFIGQGRDHPGVRVTLELDGYEMFDLVPLSLLGQSRGGEWPEWSALAWFDFPSARNVPVALSDLGPGCSEAEVAQAFAAQGAGERVARELAAAAARLADPDEPNPEAATAFAWVHAHSALDAAQAGAFFRTRGAAEVWIAWGLHRYYGVSLVAAFKDLAARTGLTNRQMAVYFYGGGSDAGFLARELQAGFGVDEIESMGWFGLTRAQMVTEFLEPPFDLGPNEIVEQFVESGMSQEQARKVVLDAAVTRGMRGDRFVVDRSTVAETYGMGEAAGALLAEFVDRIEVLKDPDQPAIEAELERTRQDLERLVVDILGTAALFDRTADVRFTFKPYGSGRSFTLRMLLRGEVRALGWVGFDLLDFLAVERPAFYVSSYAGTYHDRYPDGQRRAGEPALVDVELIAGLTCLGRVPVQDWDAGDEPLGWLLAQVARVFRIDAFQLEVQAAPSAVSLALALEGTMPLLEPPALRNEVRDVFWAELSERAVSFALARKKKRLKKGKPPAAGGAKKVTTLTTTLAAELTLGLFDGQTLLGGMLHGEVITFRGTLTAVTGSKRPRISGALELVLPEGQASWQRPFGFPGIEVIALYAELDLTTWPPRPKAFHGAMRLGLYAGEVVIAFDRKRPARSMLAARLLEDLTLFALLSHGLDVQTGTVADQGRWLLEQIRLKRPEQLSYPPPADPDTGPPVHVVVDERRDSSGQPVPYPYPDSDEGPDPSSYNFYLVPTDGTVVSDITYRQGFRVHGVASFFGLEGGVNLLLDSARGVLELEGRIDAIALGGVLAIEAPPGGGDRWPAIRAHADLVAESPLGQNGPWVHLKADTSRQQYVFTLGGQLRVFGISRGLEVQIGDQGAAFDINGNLYGATMPGVSVPVRLAFAAPVLAGRIFEQVTVNGEASLVLGIDLSILPVPGLDTLGRALPTRIDVTVALGGTVSGAGFAGDAGISTRLLGRRLGPYEVQVTDDDLRRLPERCWEALEDPVKALLENLGANTWEELLELMSDFGQALGDGAQAALDAMDDAAGEVADFADDAGEAIGDAGARAWDHGWDAAGSAADTVAGFGEDVAAFADDVLDQMTDWGDLGYVQDGVIKGSEAVEKAAEKAQELAEAMWNKMTGWL